LLLAKHLRQRAQLPSLLSSASQSSLLHCRCQFLLQLRHAKRLHCRLGICRSDHLFRLCGGTARLRKRLVSLSLQELQLRLQVLCE